MDSNVRNADRTRSGRTCGEVEIVHPRIVHGDNRNPKSPAARCQAVNRARRKGQRSFLAACSGGEAGRRGQGGKRLQKTSANLLVFGQTGTERTGRPRSDRMRFSLLIGGGRGTLPRHESRGHPTPQPAACGAAVRRCRGGGRVHGGHAGAGLPDDAVGGGAADAKAIGPGVQGGVRRRADGPGKGRGGEFGLWTVAMGTGLVGAAVLAAAAGAVWGTAKAIGAVVRWARRGGA